MMIAASGGCNHPPGRLMGESFFSFFSKKESAFFFEKKKQKTFIHWLGCR
jgi:hypothetical protein